MPPWRYHFRTPAGSLQPRSDVRGYYAATALGPDLMTNAKNAVRELIAWLGREKGLGREDAYILCSLAADLKISQIVDQPNLGGVRVHMPLSAISVGRVDCRIGRWAAVRPRQERGREGQRTSRGRPAGGEHEQHEECVDDGRAGGVRRARGCRARGGTRASCDDREAQGHDRFDRPLRQAHGRDVRRRVWSGRAAAARVHDRARISDGRSDAREQGAVHRAGRLQKRDRHAVPRQKRAAGRVRGAR